MWSRLTVAVLGLFWLLMSVLLWRNEYGVSEFSSTPLPPELVWQKILTSPDSSSLAIIHRGERIGFCHLISSVADQYNTQTVTNAPEGLVREIHSYRLDISGSLNAPEDAMRLRFDGQVTFTEDQQWESFELQIIARPTVIDLRANRDEGELHVRLDGAEYAFKRTLRLDQLNNPQAMFTQLLGPTAPLLVDSLPFGVGRMPPNELAHSLKWTAATDRMKMGHSSTHIYRLELNALQGLSVVIQVSRAGEILGMRLPDQLQLINEALTGL